VARPVSCERASASVSGSVPDEQLPPCGHEGRHHEHEGQWG
jgi:hypothetical protein